MLPSKGYFKNIVCPYFEGGLCERPHCHFRHVRKDKTETLSPTEEETTQEQTTDLDSCERSILTQLGDDDFYVLDKADGVEDKANTDDSEDLVSQIVKELKPPLSKLYLPPPNTPSYKPTPIAELKKRHIPVPNPIVRSSSSAPHSKNNLKASHKKSKIEYVPELSKRQEALLMNVYSPTPASILKENEIFGSDSPVTTTTTTTSTGSAEVPLEPYKVNNKTDSQHLSKLPSYAPQNSIYNSNYKLHDKEYSCPAESETVGEAMDLDLVDLSNELNLIGEILEDENEETEDEQNDEEITENKVKTTENCNKSEICSVLNETRTKDTGNCAVDTDFKLNSKETTEDCDSKVNSLSEDDTEGKDKREKKEFKSDKDDKLSNRSESERKHRKSKSEHTKSDKHRKESHSKSDSSKYSHKKDHNHHTKEKSLSSKTESSRIDHKKHDSVEKHFKKSEKFGKEEKSEQRGKTYKKGHKYIHDQKHSEEGKRKSIEHSSDRTKRAKVSHSKENKDSRRRRRDERRTSHRTESEKKTSDSSDSEDIVIISDDNGTPIVITDSEDESKPSDDTTTNEMSVEEGQSATEESVPVEESKDQEPQVREKKRVAHAVSGNTSASWTVTNKRNNLPSASEAMLARWKLLKEGQSKADAQYEASEAQPSSSQQGRMRIAHVPNVASLLNAKRKILDEKNGVCNSNRNNQFQKKPNMLSGTRNSHSDNIDDEDAAVTCPLVSGDIKFPVVGRQIYLQKLFEAYCQHYKRQEASEKAVEKELEICNRVSSFVVYKQSVASAIYQIRKQPDPVQSKQDAERNSKYPPYTYGLSLYSCFKKYLLTSEDLQKNNYPLNHPEQSGSAYTLPSSRRSARLRQSEDNMYECIKCRQVFEVDERGFSIQVGECCYHWGSVYRIKEKGTFVAKYVCCGYELGSKPCTTGKYHVTEMRDEDCMPGFTEMLPPSEDIAEEDLGIYALDCEMCYTTYGLELTRVTIINTDLEVVYNKLVMPDNEIIDYNTRFSGITESILQGCKTKLADVHEDLKKMFNSKTILVGHSLESDLKALKIIHNTIVDTSVAFPHRLGPPSKLSLRRLAADILQKIIQENESGHDSAEDAITCMELMIYKIKGDCSKYKPRKVVSYSGKGKHG